MVLMYTCSARLTQKCSNSNKLKPSKAPTSYLPGIALVCFLKHIVYTRQKPDHASGLPTALTQMYVGLH